MFIVMGQFFSLFSQEGKTVLDTNLVRQDTIVKDTLLKSLNLNSKNSIDKKVTYNSVGYKKNDLVNKRVILVEKAVVTYGDIEIKADSIVFNMITSTVYATGRKDTSGTVQGTPVFKEGSQEFESDSLIYNFLTKKAIVYGIVTKQEDGLLL